MDTEQLKQLLTLLLQLINSYGQQPTQPPETQKTQRNMRGVGFEPTYSLEVLESLIRGVAVKPASFSPPSLDDFERFLWRKALARRSIIRHLAMLRVFTGLYKVVNRDTIDQFLARYRAVPKSYNNALNFVHHLLDYLGLSDWKDDYRYIPVPYKVKLLPKLEEVLMLIKAVQHRVNRLFLLCCLTSGLRSGEVAGLRRCDLKLMPDGFLMLCPSIHETDRTKRSYLSFLPPPVSKLVLNRATSSPHDKAPIFPRNIGENARRSLNKRCIQQGIHVRVHDLRGIFAERLTHAGVPRHVIDALQGRQPKTILDRFYSDLSPEALFGWYRRAWESGAFRGVEDALPRY